MSNNKNDSQNNLDWKRFFLLLVPLLIATIALIVISLGPEPTQGVTVLLLVVILFFLVVIHYSFDTPLRRIMVWIVVIAVIGIMLTTFLGFTPEVLLVIAVFAICSFPSEAMCKKESDMIMNDKEIEDDEE
ncbi:MAG: hypothetical protein ACFFF4_05680 [Candidatus Thorarchaeota archaeon]